MTSGAVASSVPAPGALRYQMPLRWADLDLLNHVTNAVYVDYLEEGRVRLVEAGLLDESATVNSIAIDYSRPMQLSAGTVTIDSDVDGDQIIQTVGVVTAGTFEPYATASTGLGGPLALSAQVDDPFVSDVYVRRTDLDIDGFVTARGLFSLAQDRRIAYMRTFRGPGSFVVARIAIELGPKIAWTPEPLQTRSWISRVGQSSFTVQCAILNQGEVCALAQSVLVCFDPQTQKGLPLTDERRATLLELVRS